MVDETLLALIYDAVKDQPSSTPPPGIKSNFTDPPNHYKVMLGWITTCISITTLLVVSRMYVKIFIVRKMHIEDWILPFAYLFELGHLIPAFHVSSYNAMLHQWDIPVRNILKFLLDVHIGYLACNTAVILLKICILLQFLRIFVPAGGRSAKFWATHVLIWSNTVFFLTSALMRIFACKPMRKQWNPLITEGHCLNIRLQQIVVAGFNTGFDLVILVWTQWIIWRLKMSWTKKVKLVLLFSAGLGACIGAALNIHLSIEVIRHHNDEAYYVSWIAFWSYLETTSAFMIICLPVMPKLIISLLRRSGLLSNDSRSSSAPAANNNGSDENRKPQRSWWHISADSNNSGGDTLALTTATSLPNSVYQETDGVVEIHMEDMEGVSVVPAENIK
jgi:hypothetical protein